MFPSLYIVGPLINNSVFYEHMGAANGLGQSLVSATRAAAPVTGGIVSSIFFSLHPHMLRYTFNTTYTLTWGNRAPNIFHFCQLLAWSMTNGLPPFLDFHFIFIMMIVVTIITIGMTLMLPLSVNKPKLESADEEEEQSVVISAARASESIN